MGYVSKNLMTGEQVIHVGKVHWFIFAPGILLLLVSIGLLRGDVEDTAAPLIGLIGLFLALVMLFRAFIFKISTELAITSKRVIAKVGFISRKTVELNHSKVESFNIDQSIFGRMLGYGTILVCGTGGGKTPIPNIDDPLEFRRQAMNVVDEMGAAAH